MSWLSNWKKFQTLNKKYWSLLYGNHRKFGYVTVLNQKLYLESYLCVFVNITLLLYIEILPKLILQRYPYRVQLDIRNTSVFTLIY